MLVFDSSTLILLAKIELLELFVSNFEGEILIPESVKKETCVGTSSEVPFIQKLIKEKRIKVRSVKNKRHIVRLCNDFHIDRGEAEAIVLALERGGKIVATDDRNAIKACKLLKLEFITAISVLIRAYNKGLIDRDIALAKLKRLSLVGRYSKKIINDAERRIKGGD